MGAWGLGNFENDGALDWLAGFTARKSIKVLEKKVKGFCREKDSAEEVLVCAEIVAALNGYPGEDFPPLLEEWTEKQRAKMPTTLAKDTAEAVLAILKESELKALWAETKDFENWEKAQKDLVSRLSKPTLPLDAPKVRKPPIIIIFGQDAGDPLRLRLGEKLPDLTQPLPKIGTVTSVSLEVGQDILPEEYDRIARWLQSTPDIKVRLTDYPRRRTYRFDPKILQKFEFAKNFDLQTETATSLVALCNFKNLEKLMLRLTKLKHPLEGINNHAKLRDLNLYCVSLEGLFADCAILRSLNNLRKLEINLLFPEKDNAGALGNMELNFRSLTNLRSIELRRVPLSRLTVPLGLVHLSVNGGEPVKSDLKVELPSTMPNLLSLSLHAAHLPSGLEVLSGCKGLRYLSIQGVTPQVDTRVLAMLPSLEVLTLYLEGGDLPDLSTSRSLRFINVMNVQDSQIERLHRIAAGPALEEVSICWEMSTGGEKIDLKVTDFECFAGHPHLKSLEVTAWTVNENFQEHLAEYLKVGASKFKDSLRTKCIRELDALIEQSR